MSCFECMTYHTERHHIVFKSQGGLEFELNYMDLCHIDHRGKEGPHMNKKKDLQYKKEMQIQLKKTLCKDYYNLKELLDILEVTKKRYKGDFAKAFKKMPITDRGYAKEVIIYRLMGSRYYV